METAENQENNGMNRNSDGLKCYKTFLQEVLNIPEGKQDQHMKQLFVVELKMKPKKTHFD